MSVPFQEKVIGERLYQVINRGVVGTHMNILVNKSHERD